MYFKHKLVQTFLKATVEEENKQELAEKRVDELFKNLKIDTKSINYIPIKKDQFLLDVKKFLYQYCTSGKLYPNL